MFDRRVLVPVVAVALAIAVVVGITALVAPGLRQRDVPLGGTSSVVEKVMVSRNASAPAPKMEVSVPQASSSVSSPAGSSKTIIDAPQIARSATVSIFVDSVDTAIGAVSALTRRANGDVFDLQANDERSQNADATMTVRVPAARFESAMSALIKLGALRSRSVTAEDLTANITDSAARLRNLRRTEADIRVIMDRSGRVSEVMDAEQQLSQVREQIEQLESDLKTMRGRVAYATIDVTLQAQVRTVASEPTAAAQIVNSVRAASAAFGQSLIDLASAAIWILVFAPYYALAAGALWMLVRALRLRKQAVRR